MPRRNLNDSSDDEQTSLIRDQNENSVSASLQNSYEYQLFFLKTNKHMSSLIFTIEFHVVLLPI